MKLILPMLAILASPAFGTAIATITGLGTTEIRVFSDAEYIPPCGFAPCGGLPLDPPVIASATATGFTVGPVRNGFIEWTKGGGVGGMASDGATVDGIGFACGDVFCLPSGTQSFTLGVAFGITAFATASTAGFGSGAGIDLHFSLYEDVNGAPGADPIVVYDEATVPEPATWLLSAAGLGIVVLSRFRRRT